MCGIAGIISNKIETDKLISLTKDMCSALSHRGPDGRGMWSDDTIVLGHQRLAINDLSSGGEQPLSNEDNKIILICNGEIYNARELRNQLIRCGHRFKGNSDNEVIVHLYEEHGVAFIDKLIGMFAFILWDTYKKRLILCRDRVGEKPLYYSKINGGLAFASEPKALLATKLVNRDLNEKAVSYLMLCPAIPAPHTYFEGISAIPPASFGVFEGGHLEINKYWTLNFKKNQPSYFFREAEENFDALWKKVVEDNSLSDVPLALTLSGGIDSSSVAAVMKSSPDLMTFCLSYNQGNNKDPEMLLAKSVADSLGLNHRNIIFNPEEIKGLPAIIAAHDQPIPTYPVMQTAQMSLEISKHRKVALTGNGADEVFSGYPRYKRSQLLGFGIPYFRYLPRMMSSLMPKGIERNFERFKIASNLPMIKRRGYLMQSGIEEFAAPILSFESMSRLKRDRPGNLLDAYAEECSPRDYLDTVTYTDLMVMHQHSTTVQSDILGMQYGLEYRSPFLDVRVLEYSAGLNREQTMSLRSTRSKIILRNWLTKYLSKNIIDTPKMGFGWSISYSGLMRGPWREIFKRFVINGEYLELGIFTHTGAKWAVENSTPLSWLLLCFSIWWEQYHRLRSVSELSIEIDELYQMALK